MERVSKTFQCPVIIESGRPFPAESRSLQEFDFFFACTPLREEAQRNFLSPGFSSKAGSGSILIDSNLFV